LVLVQIQMVETVIKVFALILVIIVRSCADWLEDATTGLGFHISWNQTDTDTANFTRTFVASKIFLIQNMKERDQKSEKVDLNSKNVLTILMEDKQICIPPH